jgi:colanic acid biosynthesis glycosyl transferase WcaI
VKVAFLTQYYPPELGAPQQRLSELARFIQEDGHDMHVVTAMPSYPKGEVFDGYGGVWRRDDLAGVDVVRTFVYPSQSARMLPRLANYFSFTGSAMVAGAFALRRLDYLLVESPPLFLGMSGYLLAKQKRARMIFNVSDLWPESAAVLGVISRQSMMYRAAAQLEAQCYRRAHVVTGQSKSILQDIQDRFPKVPTYHLSNGCDTSRYGKAHASPDARTRLDPTGKQRAFVYAGLHGLAQGLDQILAAAEQLLSERHIRFVLVGDGPEKKQLMADAQRRGLHNVAFLDPVPSTEVPALLAAADGILVTLKGAIKGAVPSKIYEAMASEVPVVLVAVGEAADIVQAAGGRTVNPGDVPALVAAVVDIAKGGRAEAARTAQARAHTVANYDRRNIAQRFIAHLKQGL